MRDAMYRNGATPVVCRKNAPGHVIEPPQFLFNALLDPNLWSCINMQGGSYAISG